MLPNAVGMSQYADGGRMTTKPFTSGGAYVNLMSDLCAPCVRPPGDRIGEHACPYTVGHRAFLDRTGTGSPTSRRCARRNACGVTPRHEPGVVEPLG